MIKAIIGMACAAALSSAACVTSVVLEGNSGLEVGDRVTPFHPQHVTGPHKGTDACPP